MAPARKLFESRALNRGAARGKAQVGKEKKKITATGRRAILREEVSSVERIGIAYPFDNGERIQEPLFSSLFPENSVSCTRNSLRNRSKSIRSCSDHVGDDDARGKIVDKFFFRV